MLLYILLSFANADENTIQYQKKTEIDFEGIDVEGELIKPQGTILMERTRTSFNPLIQLRTDWNPEMRQSVGNIK
jgi:hypothetical protein